MKSTEFFAFTCLLALAPGGVAGFGGPLAATPPRAAIAVTRCSPPQAGLVTILRMPVNMGRAIWQRCTPDECNLGRPRPLEMLKSLIPKRRPAAQLARNECTEGIYKVERRAGERVLKLFPTKREECSTADAMEFL